MFDIGFAELFLLSLIGLLVLGPERLPAVARTVGGFVRKARISYHNLKRTVEAELAAADAANPVKEAQKELASVQRQVSELKEQLDQDFSPTLNPEPEQHDAERPQATDDDDESENPVETAPEEIRAPIEDTPMENQPGDPEDADSDEPRKLPEGSSS